MVNQTDLLVQVRLPSCMSAIVLKYFYSDTRYRYYIAKAGEYETCANSTMNSTMDTSEYFNGAMLNGHHEIAKLMSHKNHNCSRQYVTWIISTDKGDTLRFLANSEVINLNSSLGVACELSHNSMIRILIEAGATSCRFCHVNAALHPLG